MSSEIEPVATSATPGKKGTMPALVAVLVCLAILAGGIAIAGALIKTRKTPAREKEAAVAPLVQVVNANIETRPVTLNLNGTVMAARKIVIMPEVAGRIIWFNDKLVPGGMVKAGEPLLRIDGRDYALAMKQQSAALRNQQLSLQMEAARTDVAKREWELFQQERAAQGLPIVAASAAPPLAVREPHLAAAEANVAGAQSALSQARLRLGKTSIAAPFNAFVQMESVDIGQLVASQSQLVTLVGTDSFWVQVSVPLDRLNYVTFPRPGSSDKSGSLAKVWLDTGRGRIERSGRVIRLLGDLDPVGRMARLLIEVDDPFGLESATKEQADKAAAGDGEGSDGVLSHLPLLLGSYVHVEIAGEQLERVTELPRRALQPGNRVYVLDGEDKLRIVSVKPMWGTDETILLRGGLTGGERVIVTPLPTAVEGMLLRAASPDGDAEPGSNGTAAPTKPAKPDEAPGDDAKATKPSNSDQAP